MVVEAVWKFEVDDSDGESKQDCVNIAKAEFNSLIKNNMLRVDDMDFKVTDTTPYPYPTVI